MDKLLERVEKIHDVEEASTLLNSLTHQNDTIQKALKFATHYHVDQFRKSGEPYIIHPILVASIVSYFGGDEEMVIAALLHDVIEDTSCTEQELLDTFGIEVSNLVDGLTKITEIREKKLISSSSDGKLVTSALSFRKMLLASIKDVRVLVIKLCDRIHNMLTLEALNPSKQKRISEETLVVYTPIAHRLGISKIKNALEDLSFLYLMPKEYEEIAQCFRGHNQTMQLKLNNFIAEIRHQLLTNGFISGSFKIERRIKHHYSIYMKKQRKGISMAEILDLMAIRILVKEPVDCYRALAVMHLNFKPLISRFKDYIAIPKDNGYQTIHTTLFFNSSIFEVQIRTYNMHKTAQYGIAAHWRYKGHSGLNPKLEWLNDLRVQSEGGENIKEMYELAKDNLYSEDISVFSPKGDLFTLPRGATVLDFAYTVHTEIGDHTESALVNKQKTPLLTPLKNADIVKIITAQKPILRCSWIPAVKTAKAKNAMSLNCKQKAKILNHQSAINILLGEFHIKYHLLITLLEEVHLLKNIHKASIDSAHLQVILYQLKKEILRKTIILPLIQPFKKYVLKEKKFDNIIIKSSQNHSEVIFDYCCHPKQDDEIVAFKKNSTITVHHKFCVKAAKMIKRHYPMVFIEWEKVKQLSYKLIVSIENKKGSLAYFLLYLAKIDINVISIKISKEENSEADFIEMEINVPKDSKKILLDNTNQKYKIIEFISLNDAYAK